MISDIIRNTIFIGCGSFIGGAARYLISVAMKTMSISVIAGIALVAAGYYLVRL